MGSVNSTNVYICSGGEMLELYPIDEITWGTPDNIMLTNMRVTFVKRKGRNYGCFSSITERYDVDEGRNLKVLRGIEYVIYSLETCDIYVKEVDNKNLFCKLMKKVP